MRRWFALQVIALLSLVAAAEPVHLSFEVHGRTPLHVEPVGGPGYGLLGAAVFSGERVLVTATALGVEPGDQSWTEKLDWHVVNLAGEIVPATFHAVSDAPIMASHLVRLRKDAAFATFQLVTPLPPGRYIISLTSTDPTTVAAATERRRLAIYKGDETPVIRSAFLRECAREALTGGTSAAYQTARPMLLEAAEISTDPSVYEELADASAPWAAPDETADYYQRSLELARQNLERHAGPQKDWSRETRSLYEARRRKVDAFRQLVPYYKLNFSDVRIVVVRDTGSEQFAVERRANGARLRVVNIQP